MNRGQGGLVEDLEIGSWPHGEGKGPWNFDELHHQLKASQKEKARDHRKGILDISGGKNQNTGGGFPPSCTNSHHARKGTFLRDVTPYVHLTTPPSMTNSDRVTKLSSDVSTHPRGCLALTTLSSRATCRKGPPHRVGVLYMVQHH